MIIYAHRGASFYAPENTLSSFFMGISMGANGIETDIQETKDGQLVLFHDDDLKRILGHEGSIKDFDYSTLSALDYGIYKSPVFKGEKIVLLKDFLHYVARDGIDLALEIKQVGIENKLLTMLEEYPYKDQLTITSFYMESLERLSSLQCGIRLGYLTSELSLELLDKLKSLGVTQICPKADYLNDEFIIEAREKGFSIRAWGVKTQELMQKCCDSDIDGLTVDFPDKCLAYLNEKARRASI